MVDDGSVDAAAVGGVVAGGAARPARARRRARAGRGAQPRAPPRLAGRCVCFTDDDCRPSRGWIEALVARRRRRGRPSPGPTRTVGPATPSPRRPRRSPTTSPTRRSTRAPGALGFAPTSNLAVPADAAPGRCRSTSASRSRRARTATGAPAWPPPGGACVYEPAARVRTTRTCPGGAFWRQQARYGGGAYRYRRADRRRPAAAAAGLLRSTWCGAGFAEGVAAAGLLVLVAQVATAAALACAPRSRPGRCAVSAAAAARRPCRDVSSPGSAAAVAATSSSRGGRVGVDRPGRPGHDERPGVALGVVAGPAAADAVAQHGAEPLGPHALDAGGGPRRSSAR